jgi:hypothetical protein
MSAKVDIFCDNLRDQLNAVESRVGSVKANVQALPGKVGRALQDKADRVRSKVRAQKDRIDKNRADLKAWAEEKSAETQSTINEWMAKRETRKLNARADRAEAYAMAAVAVAMASIDEAEEAILDAVVSRMDADAALKTEAAVKVS